VKICDGISEALLGNGVEPELSVWREEAEAELANIPDSPELRAADEAILSRARSEKNMVELSKESRKGLIAWQTA
jgi:hypothetical protein